MSAILSEPDRCCLKCNQTKPADAFEQQRRDGRRRNQCRLCRNPRMIKHNRRRKELKPPPVRILPALNTCPTWLGPVSPGNLAWTP